MEGVTFEVEGPIAYVTLCREPVNSMNLDMWQNLANCLAKAEETSGVKAIVFKSGLKKPIFSAGNDITELISTRTSKERYGQFWRVQNEFLSKLYSSHLITAAAIRGQCPAGGCVLAMCCDFRVMGGEGNFKMGLNEVELGIIPPKWWGKVMERLVGYGKSEKLLMHSVMLNAEQAKAIGLIDEVVPESEILEKTKELINKVLPIPPHSRVATKKSLRGDLSKQWIAELDDEIVSGWRMLSSAPITRALEMSLQRMSKSKAKL
eukprot:c2183_g1_i1.p1 GENE.c2183_g1_i1~~c2183_g1_i1.p1  ORF type:complete len:284 (+),score=137.52 c2183_g1_i1:66-854(+)